MGDLVAKIRAAIDEDERAAKAWLPIGDPDAAQRKHIARHDPARVLRRVAAHRKILDLHAPFIADEDDGDAICQTCLEGSHLYDEIAYPCPTLKLLAEAYGIDATKD